jgi:hypothetical protein
MHVFSHISVFFLFFPYLHVFMKILESLGQSWIGGCIPDWLQKLLIRTFFWLFRALLIGMAINNQVRSPKSGRDLRIAGLQRRSWNCFGFLK